MKVVLLCKHSNNVFSELGDSCSERSACTGVSYADVSLRHLDFIGAYGLSQTGRFITYLAWMLKSGRLIPCPSPPTVGSAWLQGFAFLEWMRSTISLSTAIFVDKRTLN